jgi:kynurenine formamidase
MGTTAVQPDLELALQDARVKYRNWGRWGEEDALGTLNFIDARRRAAAAALARTGRAFSLAQELNWDGPQDGPRGPGGTVHTMTESGLDAAADAQGHPHGFGSADGVVFMPLQSGTHWDGLGHVFDSGVAWNGRDCDEVVTGTGDRITGIERQAAAFVGRGVLLDVGRVYGARGELPDGFAIRQEHLDGTIRAQGPGSAVGRGDIVLVRTGQLGRCRRLGAWGGFAAGPAPGLSFSTLEWLHGTEIAAAASDTWGFEVLPYEFAEHCFFPLHQIAVPQMGLPLGELFDLDELAADCARDGVYEFLLVAAPLPITGAVCGPCNPIAVK